MKLYGVELMSSRDLCRPNILLNGHFEIWQKATSFTTANWANALFYTADRWYHKKNGMLGANDATIEKDGADKPDLSPHYSSFKITTAAGSGGSPGASDIILIGQAVEGYNAKSLYNIKSTLSFYVKSPITGTYTVSIQNEGRDRSFVGVYTIDVADSWEFKTITIDDPPSGGNWNVTTGPGYRVEFPLQCGSDHYILPGEENTWVTGSKYGVSGMVNVFDAAGRVIRFYQIKLERGLGPTEGIAKSFQTELEECQRYFEKSYEPHEPVGTVIGGSRISNMYDTTKLRPRVTYKATKRDVATVWLYSPDTARLYTSPPATMFVRNITTASDVQVSTITSTYNGVDGFSQFVLINPQTITDDIRFHWSADSEIYS